MAAASYSFSQPADWSSGEKINGALNEHAKTKRFDMEREVAGSMSYIHRALLPAGKSVSLMLWPATGAPTPDALDFCSRIGVQSLTPAPSRTAGQSAVIALPEANEITASSWVHGDNVEVFATAASRSDARPTLEQQLAALQAEVKNPRRIAPVALSASFRDVRDEKGLADLTKALDWCAAEPLHATTAAAYAASVRDAARTRDIRIRFLEFVIAMLSHVRAEAGRAALGLGRPAAVAFEEFVEGGAHAGSLRSRPGSHITSSRQTAPGRSACGGSPRCRHRFRRAWRRATGGRAGIR